MAGQIFAAAAVLLPLVAAITPEYVFLVNVTSHLLQADSLLQANALGASLQRRLFQPQR